MQVARLIGALPPGFALTVVDVGSAGGLNPRWKPFVSIVSAILFDPREPVATGSLDPGRTRIYPVALGDRTGDAMLHITAMPNMSSFLCPDAQAMGRYCKKGAHAEVVETWKVPMERLDALMARDRFNPHVLKIDTQGSEMLVLEGAETALQSALMAEIEVSFFKRYEDQPVFADIEAHMRGRGFELIELNRVKRYRGANSLGIQNVALGKGQRAGRIAYGDALFLRREEDILGRAEADKGAGLLRTIVALLAYGKPDLAACLLDRGRIVLGPEQSLAVGKALASLGGARLGLRYLHTGVDWLSRRM